MPEDWEADFEWEEPRDDAKPDASKGPSPLGHAEDEDWDLEIEDRGENKEDTGSATGSSTLSSSTNLRFQLFGRKAPVPAAKQFESLLEALDAPHGHDRAADEMPRPPALFSALQMGLRFSDADEPSSQPSVALPHAPESAEGMLTWLQSLAAKVRYTVAVEGRAGSAAVRPNEAAAGVVESVILQAEAFFCAQRYEDSVAHLQQLLPRSAPPAGAGEQPDSDSHPVARAHMPIPRPLTKRMMAGAASGDEAAAAAAATGMSDVQLVQQASRVVRLVAKLAQSAATGVLTPEHVAGAVRLITSLGERVADPTQCAWLQLHLYEGLAHLRLALALPSAPGLSDEWRAVLPHSIRACFVRMLVGSGVCGALCDFSPPAELRQLEAFALTDLRLFSLGYSPLTAEYMAGAAGGGPLEAQSDESAISDQQALERLLDAIPKLPPQSLARAKAALALGIGFLRGAERAEPSPEPSSLARGRPGASGIGRVTSSRRKRRAQTGSAVVAVAEGGGPPVIADELRAAETLLFESACILEQRSSAQPVDLPFFVEQRWAELGAVGADMPGAIVYSVLVSGIGYTVLSALADALDRRAKHVYAMRVLEVCVAILQLRGDLTERRRLQRELCIISAHKGDRSSGVKHCMSVLTDAERQQDTNEALFVTGLVLSFHLDAADFDAARAVLERTIAFLVQLLETPDRTTTGATPYELQLSTDHLRLRLAHVHLLGVRRTHLALSCSLHSCAQSKRSQMPPSGSFAGRTISSH